MPLRLHTCQPGRERALVEELARVFPDSSHKERATGWVESHLTAGDAQRRLPTVAFASQCLPSPEPIGAPSISTWAQTAAAVIIDRLRDHEGPWRLHVFCVEYPGSPVRMVRCEHVQEAILKVLKDRLRRLARTRVVDPAAPWADGEALVQVALETPTRGWISVCPPEERERLRRTLSGFPGGVVEVPENEEAPSKAHRKVEEVELRLGRRIARGEQCVDLGGCPGGWSWVALQRGAKVIAVDRSPLREDVMSNPRLTFVKGDAFKFEPAAPVDWLLCDVIAFPQRTFELLDQWLERRLCRFFCVTVKFRGEEDYPEMERFKGMLRRRGAEFWLRQLNANRNEVTAYGELPVAREPAAASELSTDH